MISADKTLSFKQRLDKTKRFAQDHNMSVRECAWDSIRPYFAVDIEDALEALKEWVFSDNPYLRRCAVEGTRPRGVWTSHIKQLRQTPNLCLCLLEPLKSDGKADTCKTP
ncbi:DNA alkylation repair enzyme-like protein [Candidatus Magnetoovum chiemensis]|nr:DNA alkylation repair enzyme-like protein [Candidatus Magnetoovum chiemensis]